MSVTDPYLGHYAQPLVTWRATLLGALVAFVLGLMFNILGAGLGIAALTAGATTSAAGAGIVSAIWVAISNLLALGLGAWFAARSSANPDYHKGTLQGVAVWAVTTALTLVLATTAISSLVGSVTNAAGNVAGTAGQAVGQATTPQERQNAAQAVQNNASQIAADAQQAFRENQGAIQQGVEQVAETAGTATATGALGLFVAMLLGLIAAIIGARSGAKHPRWEHRPRHSVTRDTY